MNFTNTHTQFTSKSNSLERPQSLAGRTLTDVDRNIRMQMYVVRENKTVFVMYQLSNIMSH